MNARYNYALSFRLKVVQSLKHFEHLVTPCGEAIEMSTTEFGCKNMVMETIRELSRLDARELNRQVSLNANRFYFLCELKVICSLHGAVAFRSLICSISKFRTASFSGPTQK